MQIKRSALARFACIIAASAFTFGGGLANVHAETIKIGFIGPLSGGNAEQGLGARHAC